MAITRLGGANAITGTIPNSVLAAGNVIQVVSATKMIRKLYFTNFYRCNWYVGSITPSSSSSKI